jgi:MFS transporter, MHS family, shikimate and dehydroshikimate transport protein
MRLFMLIVERNFGIGVDTFRFATFGIGLLPTYDSIGIWAPILLILLRVLQGFAVGGEWAGAVLMIVEHVPKERRGFFGSIAQLAVPIGLGLATVVFGAFSKLDEASFLSWGWRLPFLLSAVLVVVGTVIRLWVSETPVFAQTRETEDAPAPLVVLVKFQRRALLQAIGVRIAENGCFYVFSTFVIAYATQTLSLSRESILHAITLAIAVDLLTIPLFGYFSDRVGRKPVYLFGSIAAGLFAFPFFWLINTGSAENILTALAIALGVVHAAMYAPQAAMMCELFPTQVRYSGISLAAQIASVLAGALAPIIASLLLKEFGFEAIAVYLIGLSVITTATLIWMRETAGRDLSHADL